MANTDNIVELNFPKTKDDIFFTKEDIKLGVELVYYGRHDPGSVWAVETIYTYKLRNGQLRSRKVETAQKLDDEIHLRKIHSPNKIKHMSRHLGINFSYLSYSAIWRLR